MKNQKGFVLLVTTIILMAATMLMISALEAFIIEKKISETQAQKAQFFYSESRLQIKGN